MQNPLDGIMPDFTIFGAEFTELWQKILAGVWALAIIAAIIFLIKGLIDLANARNGQNPQAMVPAKQQALVAGISLAALVALPVIVGAIIFFVS